MRVSSVVSKAVVLATLFATVGHAAEKINVGATPSIANTLLYVAKEEGIFEKNGLDVTISGGGGAVLVSGVVAKSLDLSTPTITTLLQAIDNGLDLSIVSGVDVISHDRLDYSVVIGNGKDLKEAKDFVGKKVAVLTVGSFLHLIFQEWLKRNNVDPTKVTYVEIPFAQMGDVLRQGTVDAAVTVQPFIGRIAASGAAEAGPDFVQQLPEGLPALTFAASNEWIESNPQTVEKFRQSLREAETFISRDVAKSKIDANVYLKMPPEILEKVNLPKYSLNIDPAKVKEWVRIMRSMSLLNNELDPKMIIAR